MAIAGSEEILYRAVFYGLLYELTGNYWIAGVISAVLFAVAHRSQGKLAVLTTFFAALVLQYFVVISGGLFLSIAIHFIHNLVNGFVIGAIREKIPNSDNSGNSQEMQIQ